MIKLRKTICDISKYQTGNLPTNAEKMDTPSTTEDMMKKATPIAVIPLFLFLISPSQRTFFNGVMFGMACMGMVSPFPDVYNVILVMKQSIKSDQIMFYGDDIYKIP